MTITDGAKSIKSLADLLIVRESISGKSEALVCGNERLTYSQLLLRARVIATRLQKLGVQAGDTVAMYMPTGIDCVVAFCGTLLLGATITPLDPFCTASELNIILGDLRPKAIVSHSNKSSIVSSSITGIDSLRGILLLGVGAVSHHNCQSLPVEVSTVNSWEENGKQPVQVSFPQIETDQSPAVIFYTSGTTGKPKGVVHSHSGFLSSIESRLSSWNPNEADRILCLLTMSSALEWSAIVMTSIKCGAALVISPKCDIDDPAVDKREALKLIEAEKITVIPGVPGIFKTIMKESGQSNGFDSASVRVCWSASGPLPEPVLRSTEEFFGAPVLEFFGMTEMCGPFLLNRQDSVRKAGSVGTPAPGYLAEILDEDGNALPYGKENVGDMVVQGPSIMLGYLRQEEVTANAFRNGWLRTGDLAYKDDDGYIFVLGRRDDRINCGGTKVYPEEVELVIAKFPGVSEVAAVGMSAEPVGECVKAFVVRSNSSITAEALQEHCQNHLASYKVPKEIVFVDKLPRTGRGKVKRKMLKDMNNS